MILLFVAVSCGTSRKASRLKQESVSAAISLPQEDESSFRELYIPPEHRDSVVYQDFDGNDVIIMNAIRDEETGEMVATETIDAAVVTARFRNIAERHGKVDVEFQIEVPESLMDAAWQVRFHPKMYILEDTLSLDDVLITGSAYRKAQLRGYQQYERFLAGIVRDTTYFVDLKLLETFIERNIPELYAYKYNNEYVSDEDFESCFGVTEKEAIEHYTYKIRRSWNDWKIRNTERMYNRYVKAPIVTDNLRLDTVIHSQGKFVYNYIQTIETQPKLRKVDIVLAGDIYEQEKRIYKVPESEPLTFYISSLSTFVDNTPRYLQKVISRKAEANTSANIEFEVSKSDIKSDLGNNNEEINNIKSVLLSLLDNKDYDLDSIVVSAGASPEGSYSLNRSLSERRSESVVRYFNTYLRHISDSLETERGLFVNLDDSFSVSDTVLHIEDIRFIPRPKGEAWDMLDELVRTDYNFNDGDREVYFGHSEKDLDIRENALKKERIYAYMKEYMYPRLRAVQFDFHLHRKGMVQDTVTTTVLDTTYMNGVQAIRDRDYQTAITVLRPYNDFNTAVAYCSADYNASALSILENLEKTAEVNYMLAVIYARQGEISKAVSHYMQSCKQNPTFVHRGNLDPEISVLIKTYGLNKEEEFDYDL